MHKLVFFLGLLFLVQFSLRGQNNEIKANLAQANRLLKEEKHLEALEYIEKALEIDPLHIEALEKKVLVMLVEKKSKDITKEIESLIKQSPQQPIYYYLHSIIQLYREKPQKAIEDLDKAIYYEMPEIYMDKIFLNRGKAYFDVGEFERAEADFEAGLEINPRYATIYHSFGLLKYELKRYDEAKELFLKAIQYEPDNSLIYYNLAMTYMRLKELKDACYYFNRSCNLGYRNACNVYLLECTE
jgi:tetratricopeptide (TPR) repeat protein